MIEIVLACAIVVLALRILWVLRTQRAELAALRRLVREEARVLAASVATSMREQRAELAALVQILTPPAAPPELPPGREGLVRRLGDTLPSAPAVPPPDFVRTWTPPAEPPSSKATATAPNTYRMINKRVFEQPRESTPPSGVAERRLVILPPSRGAS